jgi:hypothetical protein
VAFIGGEQSAEMQQVGMEMTRKVVQPDRYPERLRVISGTHLFPMEHPRLAADTAAAVLKGL